MWLAEGVPNLPDGLKTVGTSVEREAMAPPRRRIARSLLPLLLSASLASLAVPAPAAAAAGSRSRFPTTAADRVPVRPASLVPSSQARGLSLGGGGVRASSDSRTAEVSACSSMWATGIGLTWLQDGEGHVEATIRTGREAGTLGPPVEIEADEPDHAPDPGTPESRTERRATPFWWTGGSRCLSFSLSVPGGVAVRGVEAVFLNTSGTAGGPGDARAARSVATEAEATVGGAPIPGMVYRAGWGADDDLNNCDPYFAPALKMAFVHHTAGTNDYAASEVDDILRGIQYFHTQVRGWCDIAYNFLIDRFGTIYVGRKGGPSLPTVPGATQGFNTGSTAVAMMGNYSTVGVPLGSRRALERLLAWRLDVAHLKPTGWATMTSAGGDHNKYPAGTKVTMKLISGHRRTGYTECPGNNLAALLPSIRTAVAARHAPKIWRPRLSEATLTPGSGEVTFRAEGSGPLDWRIRVLDAEGLSIRSWRRQDATAIELVWKGKGKPGWTWAAAGDYMVIFTATNNAGKPARSAALPLEITEPAAP